MRVRASLNIRTRRSRGSDVRTPNLPRSRPSTGPRRSASGGRARAFPGAPRPTPRLDAGRLRVQVVAPDGTEHSSGSIESRVGARRVAGTPLASRDVHRAGAVSVRRSESPWSEPLTVEAGLLDADDWQATFVGPAWDEDLERHSPPVPTAFAGPLTRRRLYVTALGVYEIELERRRIGDHVLAPGWTSYHHPFATTRSTSPARPAGRQRHGRGVGDGWYRGALVENLQRNRYGDRLGLLCRLEITHADGGHRRRRATRVARRPDRSRRHRAVRGRDLRRAELSGWSTAGFDDSTWTR